MATDIDATKKRLTEILLPGASLRLVEPHIYSLHPPGESANVYDRFFGAVYDVVACNPIYNRIVWGYRISLYHDLCREALQSSDGWMLDAGCGSLAFTAKTYAAYGSRPIVLLDQSVGLLRMAKARLVKLWSGVPSNIVFLHGDAMRLPFKPGSISTILSLNLLHVLTDPTQALLEMKKTLAAGGSLICTTLVKGERWADAYLDRLAKGGLLTARSPSEALAFFDEAGIPGSQSVAGNLATLRGRGSCT